MVYAWRTWNVYQRPKTIREYTLSVHAEAIATVHTKKPVVTTGLMTRAYLGCCA